jgi:MFS family permease
MKSVTSLLKEQGKARRFILFVTVFYLCMFSSKTIHPLWFEKNHALVAFGFSYTAMAIAGSLSFFTGFLGDHLGPRNALRIGVLVYGVGLSLRVYTQSIWIVIISGFIAGLGASLVIVCIRYWVLDLAEKANRAAAVSVQTMGVNVGTAIGTFGSGVLALLLGAPTISYPTVLILSAVFCMITVFLVPELKEQVSKRQEERKGRIKEHLLLSSGVIFFGLLAGVTTSMITPFIPIILKDVGLNVATVGLVMAGMSILKAVSAPFFGEKKYEKQKIFFFFGAELLTGLMVLTLTLQLSPGWVIFAMLLRSLLLSLSIISEELMHLAMFPKHLVGFFFGLLQSAFFVGDALGGSFGGWLYHLHIHYALIASGALTLINAVLFPSFYLLVKRRQISGL